MNIFVYVFDPAMCEARVSVEAVMNNAAFWK